MVNFVTRERVFRFGALIALLLCLLMLGYNGRIESGDTLRSLDGISSWVRHGDWLLDESVWFDVADIMSPSDRYPLRDLDISERLPFVLMAGLYALVDLLPGVGFVHGVWLFNVMVTALLGGAFYGLALALDFDAFTAFSGALLLGLTTILLPYSQTLFREPLVALFLLLSVWALCGGRGWLGYALAILLLVLAILTKNSALFALPGWWWLAVPERFSLRGRFWRVVLRWGWPVVLAALLLVVYLAPLFETLMGWAQPVLEALGADPTYARVALQAYLFSVAGSIWGTSPLLLLGVWGAWLWLRQRPRWVWAVSLMLLGYAGGHAFFTAQHWFGGVSWPPRFLVPMVPVLMLLVLPVLTRWRRHWPGRLALIAAALYGLVIQIVALSQDVGLYAGLLPPEAQRLYEWNPGINTLTYARWTLMPRLWPSLGFDLAWRRVDLPLWALAYLLLALSMVLALLFQRRLGRWLGRVVLMVLVVWSGVTYLGLRALYQNDHAFWANKPALIDVRERLREVGREGDVLLLADNTYERFILNAYDLTWPRPIILPPQPGERPSEQQPPQITSDLLLDRLTLASPRLMDHLALRQDRLFLLAHNSPFLPWAVRPVEEYLARYYYPVRTLPIAPDPTVRLLEFALIPAPTPESFFAPATRTALRYGEHIHLRGYHLPLGETLVPGEVLPLSLYWQTDAPLKRDYVVAWFVVNEAGGVITQGEDKAPAWGFSPTSSWRPGVPVWDHRALRLPDALPSGDYRLWVVLYGVKADGDIERLPVRGGQVIEGDIGVLPSVLRVSP